MDRPSADLATRRAALGRILSGIPRGAVALSGGVDSALLALESYRALGDRVEAVTAVSESLPPGEADAARRIARGIGIRHREIRTREIDRPEYRANGADRCFFCKETLLTELRRTCEEGTTLLLGYIADDMGDHRPGLAAARAAGARAPLAEAGLGKGDVRALAREAGLEVWDKPALACLASRVAYGREVTPEVLSRVARAESALHALGFPEVRVRTHDRLASVEVPAARLDDALARREAIVAALRAAGYLFVTIDLEGLRSGSLNRMLAGDPA